MSSSSMWEGITTEESPVTSGSVDPQSPLNVVSSVEQGIASSPRLEDICNSVMNDLMSPYVKNVDELPGRVRQCRHTEMQNRKRNLA